MRRTLDKNLQVLCYTIRAVGDGRRQRVLHGSSFAERERDTQTFRGLSMQQILNWSASSLVSVPDHVFHVYVKRIYSSL
jgi:hypothetical protein